MDIAVIGRTEILYETAELLARNGHTIRVIVTAKEAPEYGATEEDFRKLAERMGCRFLSTSRIGSEEALKVIGNQGNLDLAVSLNYVRIIPEEVIRLFKYGILNAHGGDLPRYRGNACQAWALINGEDRIGLCVHKMIGGVLDGGDILAREYLEIDVNTTIGQVWSWMGRRTPQLFLQAVARLDEDSAYVLEKWDPIRYRDHSLRCYPRMPEDGKIDWHKSDMEILRLINASSEPFGGAFCELEGRKMILWKAGLHDDKEKYCAVPGQIAAISRDDGSVIVITGDGKLRVTEVEYEGFRGKPSDMIRSTRARLR
ncbi:MAG: formyl transferase [Armatimonadetes bacterium]|nr:formyl transferase [Armatimonadota bacterium]